MNVCAGFHHGPYSAGIARHFAPFSCRYKMPSIRCRRFLIGTLHGGRHSLINGSKTAHSSSVILSHTTIFLFLTPQKPQRRQKVQRLTDPSRQSVHE
jgi:hypothetical protein